ncbi:MAG: hypothetical protein GAK43_01863 [Stenotrophomonas maltophilia]|nr:MAG: hypothetical protein GAK43_01863 [Stenotrophomonas maltophilia]
MNRRHLPFCLALLCLAAPVLAASKPKALPGEADYRQALPPLAAAAKQIAGMEQARQAGQSPEQAGAKYRDALSRELSRAMLPLERAAKAGHPVAQYRLGQVLADFGADDKAQKRACELFSASLAKGFAPAALDLEAVCQDAGRGPAFIRQAKAAAASRRYASYFPQPSHYLGWCEGSPSTSLSASNGSLRAYQADLYFILATRSEGAPREGFLKQAADKGCSNAKRRLAQP